MDCYGENPRLLPTRIMKEAILPKPIIPWVPEGHYLQWVNTCISGYGNATTSSPFEYAGPLTESILIGNLLLRSWNLENNQSTSKNNLYLGRKRLIWNAEQMNVTNFE